MLVFFQDSSVLSIGLRSSSAAAQRLTLAAVREPFSKWGVITDGPGTPWSEWMEPDKLMGLLAPGKFDVVLYREFYTYLNWFDLLYRGTPDARA
jgi:hypothetical protein